MGSGAEILTYLSISTAYPSRPNFLSFFVVKKKSPACGFPSITVGWIPKHESVIFCKLIGDFLQLRGVVHYF